LSSHALADFRKCPQLFIQKRRGIIADEDRAAYLIGRAVHTLALEGGERFNAEFAVGGPINEKTGQRFGATTKAFAEWAAQQGKPVLTDEQFEMVSALTELRDQDHAYQTVVVDSLDWLEQLIWDIDQLVSLTD
jgi:hypothetical protein